MIICVKNLYVIITIIMIYLNDSSLRTIDKCNIKCLNCTFESNEIDLCVSCNINESYYPKYNDNSNKNSFINCYNGSIENYYLNDKNGIYMPCYSLCKTCHWQGDENQNNCTECYDNYALSEDGNCQEISMNRNIDYYIKQFLHSINISNYSSYYYEINLKENDTEAKNKYSDFTFIDFPPNSKNSLINNYNLDINNNKVYILIIEYPSNDLKSAVKNFDYKIFLDNGTIIDINEDIYTNIYSPLTDLFIAHYNYSIYFAKQGYDIYNKSGNFYNDKCSPAYLFNNEITLSDRKKDVYPNDVILCKDNCEYKAFNIEEKRIICDCNLNPKNNYTKKNDSFIKEEKEEKGNFFNYFLDYINYKILKCYYLLSSFENLKNTLAFYSVFVVISLIILLNSIFWLYGISKIRKIMSKHFPTSEKVYNDYIREIRKNKKNSRLLVPPKKQNKKKSGRYSRNQIIDYKRKSARSLTCKHLDLIDSSKNNLELNTNLKIQKSRTIKIDEKIKENIQFNELPYSQAIKKDKRTIFTMFISVLIEKLESVNLICGEHKIVIILIYQYILSLLIDLFLNSFLYTDDVVSNKYHNNGNLDFIVSLTLSLLSNIINSIICNFLNFSKGVEERLEQIMEIKKEFNYLYAVDKFIKILNIKIMLYFLIEIFVACFSFYYIIIFCIIYNNSQLSLLTNYLMSLVESLILTIIVCIFIAVTRKIGINYLNKKIYNTSKYINDIF